MRLLLWQKSRTLTGHDIGRGLSHCQVRIATGALRAETEMASRQRWIAIMTNLSAAATRFELAQQIAFFGQDISP